MAQSTTRERFQIFDPSVALRGSLTSRQYSRDKIDNRTIPVNEYVIFPIAQKSPMRIAHLLFHNLDVTERPDLRVQVRTTGAS